MILASAGRAADVILVLVLLMQLALGFRVLHTVALHLRHRRAGLARERAALAQPPPDDRLPGVLVQIPTFNEGQLVWRALEAAVRLDWPRDRLYIQLLDDSTGPDAATARAAAAEFRRRGHDVTLLQRADRTGFKAGALKAGLAVSDEPYVAIFDADYVPAPDFLRICLGPLFADERLAFVQARCDFLNADENRVTRAQQVILESHFAVEQATRSWAGQVLPFNGTCGVWRRAAIEAADGWQGDTLTEDLDLSYRAQMRGWRALYLTALAVPGELPATLADWERQQRRWNKGFAQTARKLLPTIWRSSLAPGRKCEATLHLGGCAFGPLLVASNLAFAVDLLLGTMSYALVLPLCALGLAQGIAGSLTMAALSDRLIRPPGSGAEPRTLAATVKITLFTMLMFAYAGAMTSRGVLDGMRGHVSVFARTPKRDSRPARTERHSGPIADSAKTSRGFADRILDAPPRPSGDMG
jgi:cellulose synthase/poly-beta-1,6-N-acetylglucosamine synthase-like glycosyltransferase